MNFDVSTDAFVLQFFCDKKRHLVCKPYSIDNLHLMAVSLDIKSCWFHKTHYDIPKKRIKEIMDKCTVVSAKEIVNIIRFKAEPNYILEFCNKCFQMTNHLNCLCQKCKNK